MVNADEREKRQYMRLSKETLAEWLVRAKKKADAYDTLHDSLKNMLKEDWEESVKPS